MEPKQFSIFFLAILLNRPDVYGKNLDKYVLNYLNGSGYGVIATSDRFPYQVSLRFYYNDDHHCSGAIIGDRFILTAGHCVCYYIKFYMLYVVVGANSFKDEGQIYRIEKAICHEDFNFVFLKNDIALLKLRQDISFNNRVHSIPLIDFQLPKKGILLMSVWGYKKQFVMTPMNFKVLFVVLIDTKTCAKLFSEKMVDDTNICTMTRGIGACIGDSGGPVVYRGHLVGIISFGKDCMLGYPNVHTNISSYSEWITEQIFFETDLELE